MTARRVLPCALLALLLAAATACGQAEAEPESADTTATPPSAAEPSAASASTPAAAGTACSLVDAAAVGRAYRVEMPAGEPGTGIDDENGVGDRSTTCTWESGDLEVRLQVSGADDFDAGELACPELSYLGDPGTPVDGLDASYAAWLASVDPNEVEARLRACTKSVLITIEIDAPRDAPVDELRRQTVTIARQVLAAG